jgi:hypothetical protein
MDRIEISVAELLEALAAVHEPEDGPAGALTLLEWSEALGLDDRGARKKLQLLNRAGRLECLRVHRIGMDGRRTNVPAYRLRAA